MKNPVTFSLRILLPIIVLALTYIIVILAMNTLNDYKPEDAAIKRSHSAGAHDTVFQGTYSMLSWNIGYGGLNKNADFFYDGGSMVFPGEKEYNQSINQIFERLHSFDSIAFILLQEVDTASARSYYTNQYQNISSRLKKHHGTFIKNYDVSFVPVPLFNPLSRVISGFSLFGIYRAAEIRMTVFPGKFPWPRHLFMPDRCFMTCSYITGSGKYLHIIHTHNSAFDNGTLREQQINLLNRHMELLYARGDYVIAGGDWNINPPGYKNTHFLSGDIAFEVSLSAKYKLGGKDWTIAFDPQYPTNRDVSTQYVPGQTPATIIDFFVCSPNIDVVRVETLHDGFLHSDHQPVYLRFKLDDPFKTNDL